MTRIALNGLGRMGKLALRRLFDLGLGGHIVLINEPAGTPEQLALLMEFDSAQGRWQSVGHGPGALILGGREIALTQARTIEDLPLAAMGVDLVIDCTGVFKTPEKIAPYFAAGVARVVVSAPVKGEGVANLVYGVNHTSYDPDRHPIVTAASCTTNCLAPMVKVVLESFGIRHASFTTIHDVTNTQTIIDRPAKDMRRARSALMNLIPTTTGSASAITQIFPELTGRIAGHAVRVPLVNASLTDATFELARETTVAEANAALKAAAEGPLAGILGYETRPLVSCDYLGDARSGVIDAGATLVTAGTQLKLYAWYDNEWGYACRLVDVARLVGGLA